MCFTIGTASNRNECWGSLFREGCDYFMSRVDKETAFKRLELAGATPVTTEMVILNG